MGMVFAAEGLDGSEKLLLLAYTNWTDPYGYCWPSEKRLADDCGTSRSTVQRAKRKLAQRKLLKSVRRVDGRGEPISNLTRVNLPLLASMARSKAASYDDDLINAITFEDDTQGAPEQTLKGTPDDPEPPADLLMPQSDSYPPQGSDLLKGRFDSDPESNRLTPGVNLTPTPSQSDSQSRIDPEGISLSEATPEAAEPERGEREEAADRIVDAYAAELGRPVLAGTRKKIWGQAADLLAAGLPETWIADRARELPRNGWTDLKMNAERSRVPVPNQHRGAGSGLVDWCGKCADQGLNQAARYNGRLRTLPDGEPCPTCHPDRVRATVHA